MATNKQEDLTATTPKHSNEQQLHIDDNSLTTPISNATATNLDMQIALSVPELPNDSFSQIRVQAIQSPRLNLSTISTDPVEESGSTQNAPCTPVEEISIEETNFLRLTLLIYGEAPQALRYQLNSQIPPNQLMHTLANNRDEIKKLFKKGIIDKSQWDLLYPPKKNPSSKYFDLTLMITLLRQFSSFPEPANGWNELPNANDNSLVGNIVRIKWYRNAIAHKARCSVNNQEYSQMWRAISKAVVNIAGCDHKDYFEQKIKELTTALLDKSFYEYSKELINRPNQDNTQYFQEGILQRWEKDDVTFVSTHATTMIQSLVERHNFVMVTGPPGSGKSASVHSVALHFVKQGYKVFSVSNTNEIKSCWIKDMKQLFVVDDAFGYHTLNKNKCSMWKSDFNDLKVCFSHNNMKIVITARTAYERENTVIDLLEVIQPMKIQINDTDCDLSVEERSRIFKKHVNFNERDDLLKMTEEIQKIEIYCFPLLCRLFAATQQPGLSPVDFFSKSVFKEEITKLKRNDPRKYFLCVPCMITVWKSLS